MTIPFIDMTTPMGKARFELERASSRVETLRYQLGIRAASILNMPPQYPERNSQIALNAANETNTGPTSILGPNNYYNWIFDPKNPDAITRELNEIEMMLADFRASKLALILAQDAWDNLASDNLIGTTASALLVGVKPLTIKRWVKGGHLKIAQHYPRFNLYRRADVLAAKASRPKPGRKPSKSAAR